MRLLRSRKANTALELFDQTEDLVFAVDRQGIVRGSCNPAALNALQRHDSIFPRGGIGVLRQCIHKGPQTIQGHLGNEPAAWKAQHVERTDQVLVVCSTEVGRLTAAASTDVLTGLANKRQFLQDLTRLREKTCLTALLLIDIDHFKQCNDTYGHEVGDKILTAVGRVIAENTRPEDRSYRYGGEELAVRMEGLINNAQFSHAVVRSRAEAIRAGVEQQTLDGVDRPITVSIGVALYPSSDNAAARVSEADRALYFAKQSGRNRVIFASEVPPTWNTNGVVQAPLTSPTS
jgi:diguanylate cyclase (GGDEF)-like protein